MRFKLIVCSIGAFYLVHQGGAATKNEAQVTQIIRDVKILPADATARAAVLNDRVAEDSGVRTGGESRSELTFADLTITRLGANTIFSFSKAGRNDQVDSGSILLRVPKDSGGGRIRSSAVTVAVTGTTLILETARDGRNRLFVLEGSARISLIKYPKQSQRLLASQMVDVPPGATTIPPPTNFDLNDLMKRHPLITDFPPLPSQDLIAAAARQPTSAPPAPPPAPGPSGPSIIPTSPNIGPIVGGVRGGSQNNPPVRHPTPTPPNKSPGKPPRNNRPPTTGTVAGTNQAPPANPPPVIKRSAPGTTTSSSSRGGNKKTYKPSPPPRRIIKKPVQTTNGPR